MSTFSVQSHSPKPSLDTTDLDLHGKTCPLSDFPLRKSNFLPTLPISLLQTKSYPCLPHGSEPLKFLCSPMPVVVSQLSLLTLLALLNPKPGSTIPPTFLFPSPTTAEISSSPALLFSLFNTNQSSFCSFLLYNFSWERVSKRPLASAGARADRTKERSHPNLAY